MSPKSKALKGMAKKAMESRKMSTLKSEASIEPTTTPKKKKAPKVCAADEKLDVAEDSTPKLSRKPSSTSAFATPCRRVKKKGTIDEDDVMIIGTGWSSERQELDGLMERIRQLELSSGTYIRDPLSL